MTVQRTIPCKTPLQVNRITCRDTTLRWDMHRCMILMPRLRMHESCPHMEGTTVDCRRSTRTVIHGRVDEDVDHVGKNDVVARSCVMFGLPDYSQISHSGLRLYNDVLCSRTKISPDDTLTFLLVSTLFNLSHPTHWILTSTDTIVENRVYCITHQIILPCSFTIYSSEHLHGHAQIGRNHTARPNGRNRAIHCAGVGGVISIKVHVNVVFSATNQTKGSAVVEAMSWA